MEALKHIYINQDTKKCLRARLVNLSSESPKRHFKKGNLIFLLKYRRENTKKGFLCLQVHTKQGQLGSSISFTVVLILSPEIEIPVEQK